MAAFRQSFQSDSGTEKELEAWWPSVSSCCSAQEVTLAERGSASPVFLWDRERVVGSLVAERQLVLSWRVVRVVEGRRR